MSGKASATEIDNHWTWADMLKCVVFMDMEAVSTWKELKDPKEDKREELVLM